MCSLLKFSSGYLVCRCLVLCCVVIFTSEMMHGWMVIMNVMDHVLGFYFIRAIKFKKKSLRWIWSEVSFMYRVGLGV